MLKKLIALSIATVGALTLFVSTSDAAVLKNARLSLSNPIHSVSSSHTYTFFHPTDAIGSARFLYCVNASGTCIDTEAILAGATKGVISGPNGDDEDDWGAADGDNGNDWIRIARNAPLAADATGNWSFEFTGVNNPAWDDCNPSTNNSTGTCYVRINTYPNTDWTGSGDQTTVSLTVTRAVTVTATVDPSFSLVISGINPGQTAEANGTTLTSTVVSTVQTIPFGNLTPGTPKYGGQSLTVTTNAVGGYSITARMVANMTGTAYGSDIDPFIGNTAVPTAVVNTQSAAWAAPDGTASGTNSGWLGIGTDDTGVVGRGNNQFFPLGVTAQTVANTSTSAQSRMSIVAVGIEVNAYQQADSYQGTLRYNALPVY